MRSVDVSVRRRRPEAMDDPELDIVRHDHALHGLARINVLSGTVGALWGALAPLREASRGAKLRILDVASGGGDVPLGLWRRFRRAGADVEIVGTDVSAAAVAFAANRAQALGASVEFRQLDAVDCELPTGFDAITCSLFLHHLDGGDAERFLTKLRAASPQTIVIDDLDRSRRGHFLARVIPRLISRSDVVHVDATRSVEGAFTVDEMRALATRCGLVGARIVRRFPCRWSLTWSAP